MSWTANKWRMTILVALACATFIYRFVEIRQVFFSSILPRMPGFGYEIEDGFMVADLVVPSEISGARTPAAQAGFEVGDRILAVYNVRGEGREIKGLFDYGSGLRTIRKGEPWTVRIARKNASGEYRVKELRVPPGADASARDIRVRALSLLFYVILPMVAIFTAFLIGFLRPDNPNAFVASLLFLSFSTIFQTSLVTFPPGFREFGVVYHTALNSFLSYLFMRFFLLFPSPSWFERRAPWIKHLALASNVVFFLASFTLVLLGGYNFTRYSQVRRYLPNADLVSGILILAMFLIGVSSLITNTWRAESKDEKRRLQILLAGTVTGLVPLILFILHMQLSGRSFPSWWLFALVGGTLGLFPLSFVYAVVRHRVLGIRLIIRRGLRYALVSRGFLAIEAGLIFGAFFFGAAPLLFRLVPEAGDGFVALMTAGTTLVALVGLRRINRRVMPAIDRRFFREAYDAQQVLTDLSRSVRRMVTNPARLLRTVTDRISDSFLPEHVALFLRGDASVPLLIREDTPLHALTRFNPRQTGDLRYCWARFRSEAPRRVISGPLDSLVFPADSFLVARLHQAAGDEPETLDVFLGDPKSWAAPVLRAHSESDPLFRDRLFLEQFGTRLLVPLVTHEHLIGFLSLGERLSEEPYSREDKALLLAVAEQTAIALDYAHLIGQVAEQERLKRDIEIAKQVQSQLFPQTQPHMRSLDYCAVCLPAREVGGDYYDFVQLGTHDLCVALGDISGKGLSASLLMASLQALMRSQAPLHGYSPVALIADINRLMCTSSDGSKYATFFCGVYNDMERRLTYVNAGHNPPVLIRPGARRNGDSQVIRLTTGGTVVGLFPEAEYEQETVTLQPGDVLVVYTDGVTEAFADNFEEFGEARMIEVVSHCLAAPAVKIRENVLQAVEHFVGQAPQHDDLTLLVMKVLP